RPKLNHRTKVPFAIAEMPILRPDVSAPPSLSTGKPSLVQITAACAPGRVCTTFLDISSIDTIARPFSSWPVTTRRTVRLMGSLPRRWYGEDHSPNDGTIANGLNGQASYFHGRTGFRKRAVAAWMDGQAAHIRFGSKADI